MSYCPALQIYSQGTNEDRAQTDLKSAVLLFLFKSIECGELGRTLSERGFKKVSARRAIIPKDKESSVPRIIPKDDDCVTIEVMVGDLEKAGAMSGDCLPWRDRFCR